MGIKTDLSRLLERLKAVPLSDRRLLVDQLYQYNTILLGLDKASTLDDTLKLARKFNSARYLMEFGKPYISKEMKILDKLESLESDIAEVLASQLIVSADELGIELTYHSEDDRLFTHQLEQLVIECDQKRGDERRAA